MKYFISNGEFKKEIKPPGGTVRFSLESLEKGGNISCNLCGETIINGPAMENQIKVAIKNHKKSCPT